LGLLGVAGFSWKAPIADPALMGKVKGLDISS